MKTCLIVEGGGFKTGFTTGILDSFLACDCDPFDGYVGISGGTIALSYYLAKQYRVCIPTIQFLAEDPEFTRFRRTLGEAGYMNIDLIANAAGLNVPFDLEAALTKLQEGHVHFVATCRDEGIPEYLVPNRETWIDACVASCTIPFITKGKHEFNGRSYFDGGWSDPLPVKWAYEQGAREILVLRTNPRELRATQSWADYFGAKYFDSDTKLGSVFAHSHEWYNESLDFINNPPTDLKIIQIAPEETLNSGAYTYSAKSLMEDYRNGLDLGLSYLHEVKLEDKL